MHHFPLMSDRMGIDGELATLRANCYRGVVRVPLSTLDFNHPLALEKHREVSKQNVQRLERIFEQNGCLRLQEENVINAIVYDEELPSLLSSSTLTAEQLQQIAWACDAPALDLGNLRCLSGLHRIEAAKRYLDDNDKWWIVRLFSADTPKPYLNRIIESFLHEQRPSDGEIFRRIILYQGKKDEEAENRWWACLDKSKLRDLRQVLRKKELATAFDALTGMPGLWTKVQLGALQRLLVLKCDEEMIAYLHHVAATWRSILKCSNQTLPPSTVDSVTVAKLELLAPRHSPMDKDLILAMMRQGELFPSQHDENIRQSLATNICAHSGLIPSLWTFFETLKYLEPICEALRKLIGVKIKRTIRASLRGYYFAPSKNLVQISGSRDAELKTRLSINQAAFVSYIELWAFCARNFDDLTTFTPRMEFKGTKPLVKGPNPVAWQDFARFAISRGYITPRAEELSHENSHTQLALDYLRKANPLTTGFDTGQIERVVAAGHPEASMDDEVDMEPNDEFIETERRSGRPYELDLAKDKKNLFFRHLYDDQISKIMNLNLVRRDLFHCIFGHLEAGAYELGSVSRRNLSRGKEEEMDVDSVVEVHTSATEDTALRRLYETLQCEYDVQHRALEDALRSKAHLQQEIDTMQAVYEQTKLEKSKLKEQLDTCCQSADKEMKNRNENFLQLEVSNKNYQETANAAANDRKAALEQMQAALEREKAAVMEVDHYKRLASGLQEQVKKLCVPTSELQLLQQSNVDLHTVSNALTGNSNDLAQMVTDVASHSTWTGSNSSNIIFVAVSNAKDGRPRGFECEVARDKSQGVQTIESVLNLTKTCWNDLSAWDSRGKILPISTTSYLFEVLMTDTLFIGPDLVFQIFLNKRANEMERCKVRKVKTTKRVKDKNADQNADKNYRTVQHFESSEDESTSEDGARLRQRKVAGQLPAIEAPGEAETQLEGFQRSTELLGVTTKEPFMVGDSSESESHKDGNLSFHTKTITFAPGG